MLRKAAAPDRVLLQVRPKFTEEGDWAYLECHSFGLRRASEWTQARSKEGSDGHWLVLHASHDGRVRDGGVAEVVSVEVPVGVFAEWLADPGASGQICNDVFELDEEQRRSLAAFATEAQADPEDAIVEGPIGVRDCDAYVAYFRRCIDEKLPEELRAQSLKALDVSIKHWSKAAATEYGREKLVDACLKAQDAVS